jgi:chromosome segregation ATPase
MKNFKGINIDEVEQIIKIRSQIAEIDNKLKTLNSDKRDYSQDISIAEGMLKDLKIRFALGEAQAESVTEQQSILNDLLSKQQKAKEDYREEIEILSAAKSTLENRLNNEIAKVNQNELIALESYLIQLKSEAEKIIPKALSLTKEIAETEKELNRRNGIDSIRQTRIFPMLPEALSVVHVVTKQEKAEGDINLPVSTSLKKAFYNSL